MLSTTWQNLVVIGQWTLKILRQDKKETVVKHKVFPNYRSGRPNNANQLLLDFLLWVQD